MCAWLRAKAECPIDQAKRAWIDRRWAWLEAEFGLLLLQNNSVILPEPEFFPEEYVESIEGAQTLFVRVCRYMQIDPGVVGLAFYEEHQPADGQHSGTAGIYYEQEGRFTVGINVDDLADPLALVATMAHELAHIHLLGHNRISREAEDHEPLTDLLTVFLGLGVISANSVIRERSWHQVSAFGMVASGWSVSKSGYLNMPMFGYALARYAKSRNEDRPAWARYLRPDVRSAFQRATRYLAEQGAADTLAAEPEPDAQPAPKSTALPDVQANAASASADGDSYATLSEDAAGKDPDPADRNSELGDSEDLIESAPARLLQQVAAGKRNFANIYLADADLAGAHLTGCNLANAYLSDADLSGADLRDANLIEAELERSNLRGAKLQGANLQRAEFTRADLTGADLSHADLRGANFEGAILRNAVLFKAIRDGSTNFEEADLAGALASDELIGMQVGHVASYMATFLAGAILGYSIIGGIGLEFVGVSFGRGVGLLAGMLLGFLWPYYFYRRDCKLWQEQREAGTERTDQTFTTDR